MKISVVIPSYKDRKHDLTISSILNQDYSDFEIIVVKNGMSKDFEQIEGRVKYYEIRETGANLARNFGIRKSKGEIVAFTDDDVTVDKKWLKTISKSHQKHEALVIGGKIKPSWPNKKKPYWVKGRLLDYLSILDYSEKITKVDRWGWLAGANITFKRDVFEKIGYFDEELGRFGNNLLSSGEVELCNRIRRSGGQILYDPTIVVFHLIFEDRLTPNYFLQRSYWQGASDFLMDKKVMDKTGLKEKYKQISTKNPNKLSKSKDVHSSIEKLCEVMRSVGYMQAYLSYYLKETPSS